MAARFSVVRELGSGGQGRVLAVRDAARGGQVLALKETDAEGTRDLRREFVLLTRLRHPNLVAVHDWFATSPIARQTADGGPAPAAYTQDWVDGQDVWRALRDAPAAQRESTFEQILRALAYLHALEVVHLDLKPENVLVEAQGGRARVLDFGIAWSRATGGAPVRGSYSYIAPEVLAGDAFDHRADLYGLGIMMAEVWVGHPPPPDAMRGELRDRAARRAWLAERGVPEAWLDVTTALTERDPAARPPHASEVASRWGRALGRTLTLHTPGTVAAALRAGPPAGRAAELEHTTRAVAAGGAVVLTGRVGAGRRSLARAAERELQAQGHVAEWWPGTAALRSVEGFVAALERLLGEGHGVPERLAAVPRRTLDPGDAGGPRDPEQFAARLAAQARELAEELAGQPQAEGAPRPVLVVDRLEAAPRVVQAFLSALVEASEDDAAMPLGLVATADTHDGPAALPLEPLGRQAIERFVALRLGEGAASARLGALLAAASGGHPAHLEALLGLLIQRGELRFGARGWLWTGEGADFDLPDGMDAAVAARVELLDVPAREALGALAWLRYPARLDEVLAARDGSDAVALEEAFAELEAAGLIWRDPEGRLRIGHPSLARVMAPWTPPGGVAAAHRRVIERADPSGLARAWHLGGAEGAGVALDLARNAWADGRLEDAGAASDLALDLAPRAAEALRLRAQVANLLGPRNVQIRCLEALLSVLPRRGAERLQAENDLFWALTRVGDVAAAETVGRELLDLAEAQGERRIHCEASIHLANAVIQRGAYDEGEALLQGALAAGDELGDPGLMARACNNLGNVQAYRDDATGALAFYERAHALKVREGDPVGQRIALGNMGLMCLKLGRSADAVTHFAASLEAARRTGHRRGEAWCFNALAVLGLEAGALDYARRRADAGLAIADELGDRLIGCDATGTLAEIALASGDLARARELAEGAIGRARDLRSAFNAAGTKAVLATAWLEEDVERAVALAAEVLDGDGGDEATRARAEVVMAEAAVRRGDLDAAEAAVRRALEGEPRTLAPRVWLTAERVLRLVGATRDADQTGRAAAAAMAEREASWPERPLDDGVDEAALVDGPSRGSFRAQPEVAALLWRGEDVGTAPSGARQREVGMSEETEGFVARAARAGGEELQALIADWLAGLVRTSGAERGFVVAPDGEVLAARDMDGEAVSGADKKLPDAAVGEVRASGAAWRGTGTGGRGAVAALPVKAESARAPNVPHVIVLQNRFVSEAFAELVGGGAEVADRLAPLAMVLRLVALEERLAQAEQRARDAEDKRRSELTRSTEEILRLRRELETTREQLGPEGDYGHIVFASDAMRKMLRRIDRVVDTDLPVYIHGESGTGKELVARAVHDNGPRAKGPFVAQNCSAIPKTLFESEFFGHEKGAFTGADRASEGLFRRADGGTLFLDEIGDLPLDLQAKLLRVLETGEVRPVGGRRSFDVDVRIVCATHRDLRELVDKGTFREDLYYRLNVVRIDVPPLRDRPDDIPLLVEHFLRRHADGGEPPALAQGVMKALIAYPWPGNVRQLENEITRAALLCDDVITVDDLSDEVLSARRGGRAPGQVLDDKLVGKLRLDDGELKDRVDRLEAWVLADALERHEGNKSQVARELGLSRAGLNMKLKRLELWEDA